MNPPAPAAMSCSDVEAMVTAFVEALQEVRIDPLDSASSDLGGLARTLLRRYRESHRHYHTDEHLEEMLHHLRSGQPDSPLPAVLVLATWYHDAIYDPPTPANEEASAILAIADLTEVGVAPAVVSRVAQLVRSTADHSCDADDTEAALFLDADLAVLGSPFARYRRYVADVRTEYAHVPDDQWRVGRMAVLDHFLQRPVLYLLPEIATVSNLGREKTSESSGDRSMADSAPHRQAEVTDLLNTVPLFRQLSPSARGVLAHSSEHLSLSAGDDLFCQGDTADALFLVVSGRLHVVDEDDQSHRIVGVLGSGAWVGELSLLTGSPRAATISAARDAQLIRISREAFDAVLADQPELGIGLARALAAQVQRTRGLPSPPPSLDTIAVLALGPGLPFESVLSGIVAEARQLGTVSVLTEHESNSERAASTPVDRNRTADDRNRTANHGDHGDDLDTDDGWAARLAEAEARHDSVVLACPSPDTALRWASFCTRSADRTVALLRGGAPPAWASPLLRGHADLAFVGSSMPSARTAAGMSVLQPRAHHHVGEATASAPTIARLARRVTAQAVGLVFSGGGARGLAHLGVAETLVDAQIPLDRLGGCSAGALVAALLAVGTSPADAIAQVRTDMVDHHPFGDVTVPRESLIKGKRAMAMLERWFGDARIEELSIPLFTVSADLASGDLVVHREGLIRDAVAASMAIPGFAPALRSGSRLLVDGGLLNNFPVDVMADTDEGPVVGVDVMRELGANDLGRSTSTPGIVTTIARAMVLGGWQRAERNRRLANVLISPEIDMIGLFEFDRIDDALEAGRVAARAALPSIRACYGFVEAGDEGPPPAVAGPIPVDLPTSRLLR